MLECDCCAQIQKPNSSRDLSDAARFPDSCATMSEFISALECLPQHSYIIAQPIGIRIIRPGHVNMPIKGKPT